MSLGIFCTVNGIILVPVNDVMILVGWFETLINCKSNGDLNIKSKY